MPLAAAASDGTEGLAIPKGIKSTLVTRRKSKRPVPGQPPAKFENKRCNAKFPPNVTEFKKEFKHSKAAVDQSPFRVIYSSMIPRLRPTFTALVRSFAPSFERILVTCLLTVSAPMESNAAISLFEFPVAISWSTSISRGVN